MLWVVTYMDGGKLHSMTVLGEFSHLSDLLGQSKVWSWMVLKVERLPEPRP